MNNDHFIFELVRLLGDRRAIRITAPSMGLSLEKVLGPTEPVAQQKNRPRCRLNIPLVPVARRATGEPLTTRHASPATRYALLSFFGLYVWLEKYFSRGDYIKS